MSVRSRSASAFFTASVNGSFASKYAISPPIAVGNNLAQAPAGARPLDSWSEQSRRTDGDHSEHLGILEAQQSRAVAAHREAVDSAAFPRRNCPIGVESTWGMRSFMMTVSTGYLPSEYRNTWCCRPAR